MFLDALLKTVLSDVLRRRGWFVVTNLAEWSTSWVGAC